ncbi:quinone oxidoreductase [Neocloeon triangulifer]|uniref:quinone oxidoreductase n=1 Tax=Neocloeon triangulifer TaxID=2078957 RepID=UPI00286FA601|nr:quinone oxidoreductase [Neocloeon triangulifer]
MNKLCRQVSIESPGATIKDCVFSFEVPVPDVPPRGARIRVACAGACYRLHRTPSLCSVSSNSSDKSFDLPLYQSPAHQGVRDAALYPGFEVAGIIESLGSEATVDSPLKVGDRVVIFPYEGVPHGYAEYITVQDLKYLVKVPDRVPLSVAAMLPTGALLAMNTVIHAREYTDQLLKERGENARVKILVVGTGGLALWALRIVSYEFKDIENQMCISVATLRDEGFQLAKENHRVNLVQWNEDVYEKQLIERTIDSCKGEVDIVIDFGTTSRSLHRSLQCLNKGGVVFISAEVAERLMPKFSKRAEEKEQCIRPVDMGSIEQLEELVELVSNGKIIPPPHSVFPADQATEVIQKLCHCEIPGRAILQFFAAD